MEVNERFRQSITTEKLDTLIDILKAKRQTLDVCRGKLNANVQTNYRSLYNASNSLMEMHKILGESSARLTNVVDKMSLLSSDTLAMSCNEFEELAKSLKDNLSGSLCTIWFASDDVRNVSAIDVEAWLKASENITQSVISLQVTNITPQILTSMDLIHFTDYAPDKTKMSRFSRIVNMLPFDEELNRNIISGYTHYATATYISPIEKYVRDVRAPSACAAIVLYSFVSSRIILDLLKLQAAMPEAMANAFTKDSFALIDTFMVKSLLTACCKSQEELTTASLKILLTVFDALNALFPMPEPIFTRILSQTISRVVYYVFQERCIKFFRNFSDLAEADELKQDLLDSTSALQHFVLACCANSDQRVLVGVNLYAYCKLYWIGCLMHGEPLDNEVIEQLLTDIAQNALISTSALAKDEELVPPLQTCILQNLLEFVDKLKSSVPADSMANWDNAKRATYVDVLKTLSTVEEQTKIERGKFGIDHWNVDQLNLYVNRQIGSLEAVILESITEEITYLLNDKFVDLHSDAPELPVEESMEQRMERDIIEPMVALIAQVNYYCSAQPLQSPVTRGEKDDLNSPLHMPLYQYMKDAIHEYPSHECEALVRSSREVNLVATRLCGKHWREALALSALLQALAEIARSGFREVLDSEALVKFLWVVLRLAKFVIPKASVIKPKECFSFLTGILCAICKKSVSNSSTNFAQNFHSLLSKVRLS